VFLEIGGIQADVLIDCGSTTEMMSPNFMRVAKTELVELETQMGLRLAVKGSSSKLNYGVWADMVVGNSKYRQYFDIVNLDRHDVILGTPFLWANEISISFTGDGYLLHKGHRIDVPTRPSVEKRKSDARKTVSFFRAEGKG
jgi:hypothetical protein